MLDEWHAGTYGVPDEKTLEAIRLGARLEGMLTDPVYEGKSLAALIDLVRDGRITRVSYLPCTINKAGQPFPLTADDPRFHEVAGYFDAISRHQGFNVRLTAAGDEILVEDGGTASTPIGAFYTKFITAPIERPEPALPVDRGVTT